MSSDRDDPRLTAYALGEMDAEERTALEREMAADPELKREVDAVVAMAGALTEELGGEPAGEPGGEPALALTGAQRHAIEVAAEQTATATPSLRWWTLATAAVTLLAVGLGLIAGPSGDDHVRLQSVADADPATVGSRERNGREAAASEAPRETAQIVLTVVPVGTVALEGEVRLIPPLRGSESGKENREVSGIFGAEVVVPQPIEILSDASEKAEKTLERARSAAETDSEERRTPAFLDRFLNEKVIVVPTPGQPSGQQSGQQSGGPVSGPVSGPVTGPVRERLQRRWSPVGGKMAKQRDELSSAAAAYERLVEELARTRLPQVGAEVYDLPIDNPFRTALKDHTSTFSIDVDTASYANVRRFLLRDGVLPPPAAVRVEELINYFGYDYTPPAASGKHPFSAQVEVASCPWNTSHRLARIALKGREVAVEQRPAINLVFLIDVSGSMRPQDKLPLLKQGLAELANRLDEGDRLAIVTYANTAGVLLPSTTGDRQETIQEALGRLTAGGSTNGGAGIQLAYREARRHFLPKGVNRVVLATDGDFNVGITDRSDLVTLIEEQAGSGVFLSVLGFGTGNLKDGQLEELSNRGNGNYAYIDSLKEARRVLVEQMTGTLVTIAKDVKVQVFFNPRKVQGYRLIGYANRMLRREDFNDDTRDAGEIGAGHAVTALYEIVPAGMSMPPPAVDRNPFVEPVAPAKADTGGDGETPDKALLRLRLRYKLPDGRTSALMERDVVDAGLGFDSATLDFRWSATVAAFGMMLRDSKYRGNASWEAIFELGESARGEDPKGERRELLDMALAAQRIGGASGVAATGPK